MQLIWFSVILLSSYFGTLAGLHFWLKKHTQNQLEVKLPGVVAGILVTAFLLGLACCNILWGIPKLTGFTMVSFLLLAVLFLSAKWENQKKIWMPLVCLAGSYVVCKLCAIPFDCMTYLMMSGMWLLVMALVVFFDRLPLLSFFMMAAWAVAFAMVVLIQGGVPLELAVILWLSVVPLWALIRLSGQEMKGSLGPYGAALLGFVMGAIIALCVGLKAYNSAVILMSYYLFEWGLYLFAGLGWHFLGMKKGDFAYMLALQKGNSVRIVKTVFYHLIILSLIAVLSWNTRYVWSIYFIVAIVLLDVYNRFKLCDQPEPSLRQLYRETKLSFREMYQQFKLAHKVEAKKSDGANSKSSKSMSACKTLNHRVKRKKKK